MNDGIYRLRICYIGPFTVYFTMKLPQTLYFTAKDIAIYHTIIYIQECILLQHSYKSVDIYSPYHRTPPHTTLYSKKHKLHHHFSLMIPATLVYHFVPLDGVKSNMKRIYGFYCDGFLLQTEFSELYVVYRKSMFTSA